MHNLDIAKKIEVTRELLNVKVGHFQNFVDLQLKEIEIEKKQKEAILNRAVID